MLGWQTHGEHTDPTSSRRSAGSPTHEHTGLAHPQRDRPSTRAGLKGASGSIRPGRRKHRNVVRSAASPGTVEPLGAFNKSRTGGRGNPSPTPHLRVAVRPTFRLPKPHDLAADNSTSPCQPRGSPPVARPSGRPGHRLLARGGDRVVTGLRPQLAPASRRVRLSRRRDARARSAPRARPPPSRPRPLESARHTRDTSSCRGSRPHPQRRPRSPSSQLASATERTAGSSWGACTHNTRHQPIASLPRHEKRGGGKRGWDAPKERCKWPNVGWIFKQNGHWSSLPTTGSSHGGEGSGRRAGVRLVVRTRGSGEPRSPRQPRSSDRDARVDGQSRTAP